jgi:hypothetical protein
MEISMRKAEKPPERAGGKALPEATEKKRLAVSEVLQTIERLYRDRPYLAFFLVRGAIRVLDERKVSKSWVIGGSITILGSGAIAAAKATGLF